MEKMIPYDNYEIINLLFYLSLSFSVGWNSIIIDPCLLVSKKVLQLEIFCLEISIKSYLSALSDRTVLVLKHKTYIVFFNIP